MKKSVQYDVVAARLYEKNPQLASDMLNECLLEGAIDEFLIALRHIAQAHGGLSSLSRECGLHEKTLYKTLSKTGNPSLKTLMGVIRAIGMRITLAPAE